MYAYNTIITVDAAKYKVKFEQMLPVKWSWPAYWLYWQNFHSRTGILGATS